jgi:hypothetical protein
VISKYFSLSLSLSLSLCWKSEDTNEIYLVLERRAGRQRCEEERVLPLHFWIYNYDLWNSFFFSFFFFSNFFIHNLVKSNEEDDECMSHS